MRRTVGFVVGACALVALGGMAAAAPATKALSRAQVDQLRSAAAGAPEIVGTTDKADQWLRTGSLTLDYPGASYVKPHLDRLILLPGDSLTVSNPSGTESTTYRTGALPRWAMSVDGDKAVLTLHRGRISEAAGLGAHIDKVAHGFTAQEKAKQKGADRTRRDAAVKAMQPGDRTESVCGSDDSADAVCYKSSDPVAYNNSRAVARLLINGDELCSAWRVGPNNRMFTNHHCFTTSDDAQNTEVWFNYECVQCGGYQTQAITKVWGDQVLATDDTLDFTLFSVQDFGAIQGFGYLNLDVRDPAAGEQLYIPQHPGGDPTVIAMDSDQDKGGNCQIQDPAVDGYGTATDVSYYCDTAGGSSGSPVISRVSNKVIALHHFGGCPNAGVRIDLIYQKVKSLL